MKVETLIVKNTLSLSSGKVFGDLSAFFFLMYFGRVFGTGFLGKYAFAMSAGGLLTVFVTLGLNTYLIRDVSKDRTRAAKYIGNLLVLRALLSMLTWGLIALFAFSAPFSFDTRVILLFMGGYHIFYKLSGLLQAGFMAHEEMHFPAFLEFYHKLFILLIGVGSAIVFMNPVLTLAVYPLSALSMFVIALIMIRDRYGKPDFSLDYGFVKKSIISAAPFFLIIILNQFYDRIGIIILTYFKGEVHTGIFSASDRLLAALNGILAMFATALFPVMAKFSVNPGEKLYALGEWALRLLIVASIPLCLAIFVLNKEIISLAFGSEFIASAGVLRVASWSLLFIGLNFVISSLLIVTNHQNELIKIRLLGYLGYFMMSLFLVNQYSYIGLAWAKVFVEGILFIVTLGYAHKVVHGINIKRIAFIPFVSLGGVMVVLPFLRQLDAWMRTGIALVLYTGVVVALGGIHRRDIVFFRDVFRSDAKDDS